MLKSSDHKLLVEKGYVSFNMMTTYHIIRCKETLSIDIQINLQIELNTQQSSYPCTKNYA